MKSKFLLPLLFSLFFTPSLFANNLIIGAPVLVSTTSIQFTIQWDNSWFISSGPSNWDAVWVFVKYQDCATNLWKHVDLSTVAGNHSVTGAQLQINTVADAKGVFLRLSALGNTNVSSATVTLKFNTLVDAGFNYQVFGIEMVNVPQGDFYIGDGTRGTNQWGFSDVNPYPAKLINNNIQNVTGLGAAANYQFNSWGSTAALGTSFPLGWNSFYCMKYEISQEQYTAFLNTLTYDQQVACTASNPNSLAGTLAIASAVFSRNGIRIKTSGAVNNLPAVYGNDLNANGVFGEAADGQTLACNWLAWSDMTAYMDWAALRPMTEFEYEKVCRGTNTALTNEYAWSTTNLLQALSTALINAGAANETSTSVGAGLCAYGANTTADGPLRCGFAATAATTRTQAGGAYYGAMDMSGNVMEQCVGGYNFNYSGFTNTCGDGTLSTPGAANVAGWPALGGGQGGGIARGGDWFTATAAYLNISDRAYMTSNFNQLRDYRVGGRGVR
jgi:formylglycine-generating enzyme required for sulfatase activity